MSAFDFVACLFGGCGSSGEGVAGAGLEVVDQAVVFAEGGGSDLEDGFGSLGVVPEHLGPFDAEVDLFDERLHPRRGHRQAGAAVVWVVPAVAVVGPVGDRFGDKATRVGFGRVRRCFAQPGLPDVQFCEDLVHAALPAAAQPGEVLAPRITGWSITGWGMHGFRRHGLGGDEQVAQGLRSNNVRELLAAKRS